MLQLSDFREVTSLLKDQPACITGGGYVALADSMPRTQEMDLDVFTYSDASLFSCTQILLSSGYALDDRNQKVWNRWLRYGVQNWHTNSVRLTSHTDVEINIVYKKVGREPLSSLAQVLESFDFGFLAQGIDLTDGEERDMRPFFFPSWRSGDPTPMLPQRHDAWQQGLVSQFTALRQFGRYAKYHRRGFNMSLIKPTLVKGYMVAGNYHKERAQLSLKQGNCLGDVYHQIASLMRNDRIDELIAAGKEVPNLDTFDEMMGALQ